MGCLVTMDWRLLIQKEGLMMLKLKHNEADGNKRIVSHWKMMQKYIGADITSMVTLPVLIFLANDDAAENGRDDGIFPPAKKLADECEDPHMRMFLGNSLDIYPLRRTRLKLKRDGVILELTPPPTKVNNLIFGNRHWGYNPGENALIYQSCDLEGEPLPGTDLKEVWEVAKSSS
ncbi:oxysterol-binding protein [Tanacetum coccineum]|uniref:Oxysterol-binding protein n=1 Tax=Tanacetum coccineum TaxID=301880 RepID=A0ABQ5AQE6_9ASTR